MEIEIVEGDLLEQDVEVIVNPWNRNIIPWWLLLPQGVSGAIRKHAGTAPFRQLRLYGPMPLGEAAITGPGKLKFKGIIHVASINAFWFATERAIRTSVKNAMRVVKNEEYGSVAFPLLGTGTGGFAREQARRIIQDELEKVEFEGRVLIVMFPD